MAFVEIKNLTFSYKGHDINALDNVNLAIEKGEFIVICGQSGCGKTTLLRHLKSELAPFGNRSGSVLADGQNIDFNNFSGATEPYIGFVMQDPDSQIVTDKVWHELAFGLENLGLDTQSIRRKTAETASFFGIQSWYHMPTAALSGGQKQLLNLAAVMVMQPSVLVLDEPTSRLDPIAASEFISAVAKLNRELGVTIIMTEHQLDEVLPLCTRSILMDSGHIIFQGSPLQMGKFLKKHSHRMFRSMPAPMRVWSAVSSDTVCPLTVLEGKQWLENFVLNNTMRALPERTQNYSNTVAAELRGIHFKYEKNANDTISGLDLKAYSGQLLAVIGGNGTGKTTMLSILAGISKPYRGQVFLRGRTALLPQDPKMLFLHQTVYEELSDISHDYVKILETAKLCDIEHLMQRHPYDLSGGEQQKAALAKVLLLEPDILLMDEPTKGLDNDAKVSFACIIKKLLAAGKATIMVSHDIDFCAEYANEIAMIFDGAIVSSGDPVTFFSQSNFYTTVSGRMSRNICPKAITPDEIITICGGTSSIDSNKSSTSGQTFQKHMNSAAVDLPIKNRSLTAKISSVFILLILIPLTAYLGLHFLEARRYFFISTVIIVEVMIPFIAAFEKRKPRARELIVISVLCAIAIAGRTAFSMLPQFKPVLAIVIISGAALGPECGALVGALTMFISNMLFSQGIWTPWQMFAAGSVGFISGIIFYYHKTKSRYSLPIFGVFAAILIYGGIMNPATVLMYQENITFSMILASYTTGFPMDVIHAFATFLFLWFLSRPMIGKINRIKLKYGLTFV